MARNTSNIDYREDYYRGPAKFYFSRILETIIRFGDLRNSKGLILDYGCGHGHLKKMLPAVNVVGYDIIPELSEVENFDDLFPEQIVLSGVLEHLYENEIRDLLARFRQMNPRVKLLVYLPTENWLSKIAMRLAGKKNAHDDHVSKYQDVNKIIEREYFPAKRSYVWGMAQVTKYIPY